MQPNGHVKHRICRLERKILIKNSLEKGTGNPRPQTACYKNLILASSDRPRDILLDDVNQLVEERPGGLDVFSSEFLEGCRDDNSPCYTLF